MKKPHKNGSVLMRIFIDAFLSLSCFKTLLELVNSSACINKLLLAGEEGMALRANFNTDLAVSITLSRTGNNSLAACATDGYFFIIGMNSRLHFISLLAVWFFTVQRILT